MNADAAVEDNGALGQVSGVFVRLLDRNVGGLSGATGRAVTTTHAFLIFLFSLSFAYVVFHMTYDHDMQQELVVINLAAAGAYLIGIVAARLGKQRTAASMALGFASAHIFFATQSVGWQTGMHLYLIAGGQLVLMLFTDRQQTLRWIFVTIAAVTFVYCQLTFDASQLPSPMTQSAMATLFAVNAVSTAVVMYLLAILAHTRAISASRLASASAARAEYLANTDALTGLSNRRPVMEHLELLSTDPQTEYCVGLADLDNFKALNDEYGHVCGDRVLATLGERLRNQVRPSDSVGRWGGEEFIFVMPFVKLEDAVVMMERMRGTVGNHVVPCSGHSHHVTVSIGVSARPHGALSHRVIKRADDALYEAKQSGRNQVKSLFPVRSETMSSQAEVAINPGGGEGHRTRRREP